MPTSFQEDTTISLPGVFDGSVAWADYNSDGKPDFLLTGLGDKGRLSKLYKNTGNGFIEDTNVSLPGVRYGSVAWADYNNDKKPDFLLTGQSDSQTISKLYKNTGNGFIEDTSISLPGVRYGSVAWADYNRDGKPDFLLTGYSDGQAISKLYSNTGNGFQENTTISLPGVSLSSVAWADYNRDDRPDFLLTGRKDHSDDHSSEYISQLYQRPITGGFIRDRSVSLPGVFESSVTFADYNNDNLPDLLLTGRDNSGRYISKLYKNQRIHNNTGYGEYRLIEDTNVSLPGVSDGSVAWADYNGDGTPDVLLTGTNNSEKKISKLYISKKEGSNVIFSEDTNVSLPGVSKSSIARADYNGDGKPDLLLTGYTSSREQIAKLYKNTSTTNNTINGTSGSDNLMGTTYDDLINGFTGDDTLNGNGGDDSLIGHFGNDVYIVNSKVYIKELSGQGTDLVLSSTSISLTSNVENFTLTGMEAINAEGNSSNNYITGNNSNNNLKGLLGKDTIHGARGDDRLNGNEGDDTLNGGVGADTLTGGSDVDLYVFQFGQSTIENCDRITDFTIGVDKIDLLTGNGDARGKPKSFSRASDNNSSTTLDALVNQVFNDANGADAGNQALNIGSAAVVVATNPAIAGTYLIINNSADGFQASQDSVVNITGYIGTLPNFGVNSSAITFI